MFAFRLAAHLRTTVRGLLSSIGSDEFTEWMAFERIEPFGVPADEYRLGAIAAAIYNSQRSAESDHYFTPDEFMPALAVAKRRTERVRVEEVLTDDQHAALFDASIFGKTRH